MMQFTGNVKRQIKMMEMKHNWEQKKKDPAALASQTMANAKTAERAMLEAFMAQPKYTPGVLDAKLSTGKTLTPAEMDYLRSEHPALYAKAVQVQTEREEYERALKRCRTKDEVRSLRMGRAAAHLDSVRSASLSGDLVGATQTHQQSLAVTDEHIRFTATARYQALPENEAELAARKKCRRNRRLCAVTYRISPAFYYIVSAKPSAQNAAGRSGKISSKSGVSRYEECVRAYEQTSARDRARSAHKKKRIQGSF